MGAVSRGSSDWATAAGGAAQPAAKRARDRRNSERAGGWLGIGRPPWRTDIIGDKTLGGGNWFMGQDGRLPGRRAGGQFGRNGRFLLEGGLGPGIFSVGWAGWDGGCRLTTSYWPDR